MKRNLLLLWIRDALNAGAAALTSVSMLSAFFLSAGLSEEEIGVYLALTPFVNFIISLLFSGITARVRKTVRAYSLTGFLTAAATLLFLFFCRENMPHGVFYAGIMSAGCLLSVFTALKSIFDYKQPCEVMELSEYSVYVSFNGIVTGVAGILCGAALARLYAVRDFYPVTAAAFLSAGLFLAAASALNGFLRVLHPAGSGNAADAVSADDHPADSQAADSQAADSQAADCQAADCQAADCQAADCQAAEKKSSGSIAVIRALFADRDFQFLLIPNLVRGFGAGAVSLVPVIAVSACAMDESGLAFITVCTYIGTLGSCLLYAWMSRRFGAARTGVLGGIGFCLIIPCFAGGKLLFFLLYTLSYVGYNIMCCAVPETVYLYVPEERVSAFHTWRLALTTLGTTLSTAVFGKLLDRVPPYVLTAAGAASVLVCVLGYRLCFRGRKNFDY